MSGEVPGPSPEEMGISATPESTDQKPEKPPIESGMEKWDRLDEQIEELKAHEDKRLLELLRDVHEWRESLNIDPLDSGLPYYFAAQDRGTNAQLEVKIDRYQHGFRRITVVESSLGSEEDPNTISVKANTPKLKGTLKGGVVYDYAVGKLDSVDAMVTDEAVVGYKPPDEEYPWDHPEGFKNAYGRNLEYIGGPTNFLRNRPPEKEKRFDPISEGERVLNLLKSASSLGRLDPKTGQLEPIQPEQVSPSP